MLKKVIATATAVGIAVLASASVTTFAESFSAISVSTEAKITNADVTNTGAEADVTDANAETTTMEAVTTTAEVDDNLSDKADAKVRVGDAGCFPDGGVLIDADGGSHEVGREEGFYIISKSGENFRAYVPKANMVLYLTEENATGFEVYRNDVLILGDLNYDGEVNVFDLSLLKRGLIYGWDDTTAYHMADMSGDGYVNVADLVYMQRWLLGVIK